MSYFHFIYYLQYISRLSSGDRLLHPASLVASQEKLPWNNFVTCSNKSLLGSISHKSSSSWLSPEFSASMISYSSSLWHIGSCFNSTPSMNHFTLFNVDGLPEITSQNSVTFFLSSSLIGEVGDIRSTTSGSSEKGVYWDFNHCAI